MSEINGGHCDCVTQPSCDQLSHTIVCQNRRPKKPSDNDQPNKRHAWPNYPHRSPSLTFIMTALLYPLFPVVCGLGFVLVLIPLPWHLEAWNSGTCFYMIWTALACLNQFVNSIVWSGDAINRAPVWCDICKLGYTFPSSVSYALLATRITIGASVGIPLSSFCIIRRLHSISCVQAVAVTREEVRPTMEGHLRLD